MSLSQAEWERHLAKKAALVARPRLYIFDADGTLRRCTAPGQVCPNGHGEWELLPGVREKLAELASDPDVRFGVASNQGGVAAGHLTSYTASLLLQQMIEAAFPASHRSSVELRMCPHDKRRACSCRKPSPAMLLDVMRAFRVTSEQAVMVGDMASDEEAARAAGCSFVWAWDFFGFPAPRPVPSPRAPGLDAHREILAGLLEVERERLVEARALEKLRGMIFPETTVILRDVQRLSAAVHLGAVEPAPVERPAEGGREETRPADPVDDPEAPLDLAAMAEEIGA